MWYTLITMSKTRILHIRISDDQAEKLKALTKKLKVSWSDLIRIAISEYTNKFTEK